MDFFERHSFGEVPLLVYDEFVPGESNCGYFRMASDESLAHDDSVLAFVIPHNYWEERLGEALWRKFDTFKLAIVSGTLVDGKVVKEGDSLLIKADRIISGGVMLSALWGGAGIRHVDFIERAVPIPEEEEGFHDYIRRWRERELREQGILKREIEPDEYNSKFMRVQGPIRYHLFLSEDTENEPESFYKDKKAYLPKGCPAFEDLLITRIEMMHGDLYWGPIWHDTEYPEENSLWMWVIRKDTRYMCRIALANRAGNLSLMVVPFYFSFVL